MQNPVVAVPEAGSVAATSTPHAGTVPAPLSQLAARVPGSTHQGGSVAGLRGWVVAMASAVLGQEEPWEPGTELSPTVPAEAQSRFCPRPQQQR